jgi:hypothetical protein
MMTYRVRIRRVVETTAHLDVGRDDLWGEGREAYDTWALTHWEQATHPQTRVRYEIDGFASTVSTGEHDEPT